MYGKLVRKKELTNENDKQHRTLYKKIVEIEETYSAFGRKY